MALIRTDIHLYEEGEEWSFGNDAAPAATAQKLDSGRYALNISVGPEGERQTLSVFASMDMLRDLSGAVQKAVNTAYAQAQNTHNG